MKQLRSNLSTIIGFIHILAMKSGRANLGYLKELRILTLLLCPGNFYKAYRTTEAGSWCHFPLASFSRALSATV
jgi:hypothetical protein